MASRFPAGACRVLPGAMVPYFFVRSKPEYASLEASSPLFLQKVCRCALDRRAHNASELVGEVVTQVFEQF